MFFRLFISSKGPINNLYFVLLNLIICKFLMPNRELVRSIKISNLLENLLSKKIVKANLGGIDIKKDDFSINFGL